MKQYEFEMVNKRTGRIEHKRATAANAEIARAQIVVKYAPQFIVAGLFCDVNPPHHILGEIDCADFPAADFSWLMREAAKAEGVTQ